MSIAEQNLSLYEDKLQFYLVYTIENSQFSTHMQFAREKLEENVNASNIKDVTPTECLNLAGNFTKKHIVIFDEFDGECFEAIKNTQALVLGPRCVISCFMDNVTLPDINSPMYNLAMRDLIICLSSFTLEEKAKLNKYIGYMGGRCIQQFTESVTHLITSSIKPQKHEIAVTRNVILMKDSWVYAVWKENLKDNILANNKQFDGHKLPIFYNVRVTSTGLNRKEKKDVEDAINKEGGFYFGEYSSGNIDVVICKRDATETPKIKAALNAGKECLCIEWIYDSLKRGAALPVKTYLIDLHAKKTTSTPEKRNSGNFENTQASAMNLSNIPFDTINDTAMSNLSIISETSMSRKRKSNDANENKDLSYKIAYDKLNFQEAKRAGTFLDGCSIFICGFTNEEKEKINKILNAGGATRYDTINSKLTHIVIGSPSKKDVTMLMAIKTDATMVKLDWLVESIAQKVAVDTDKYVYNLNNGKPNAVADEEATAPSPASKRNILLMSQSSKQGTPKRLNFDANSSMKNQSLEGNDDSTLLSQTERPPRVEDDIIDQYLKAPAPLLAAPIAKEPVKMASEPIAGPSKSNGVFKVPAQPPPSNDSEFETDSEFGSTMNDAPVMFLAKQKVCIKGFETESHELLAADCRLAGAEVIEDDNYKGTVDFLIMPVDAMSMDGIKIKAKSIVNHDWLINAKRLYQLADSVHAVADPLSDIPYFYRPIFFPEDLLPLANMVIVFSLYSNDERSFLFQMAQILGADTQDTYSRSNKPLLICPEAKSQKYDAAIRWKLPVVNKNWLLECYKLQKRVALRNYLVGEALAPVDDIDEDDEVLSSQSVNLPESSSNKYTPAVQNKRVEQLRAGSSKSNPNSNRSSPTSNNEPSSPIIPTFNREVLNELDTPTRESILQRWKELDEQTPETKRRRYEAAGIKTPEIATTPYWMEYKWQQCEERRTRHAPTQEQIDKIKNRTPWSEVKRNFWKQALGDEYESPSQCYSANMRSESTHANDIVTRPTGRVLTYEQHGDTEADANIQALADLIKRNREENNEQIPFIDLPNTAPPESEMVSTVQHEVIGWRDPSEVIEDTPKRNSKPKNQPCFSISCSNDDIKNRIIKQIIAINGKVCEDLVKYDSACTHFLCEKPSRSEKMLSCVASGKWVLGLSYIQKSYEANHFLDEEEFEWGNPKATNLPQIDGNDVLTANAAHRWRKKLHSVMIPAHKGIFKNLRAILKTGKDESLRRLIEAGLGQIIEVNANLPLDKQLAALAEVTHIICQPNYANFTTDEIKALDEMNVHRVTINYLQSCILNETTPDVKAFLFKRA